jgi:hypothetical protein
MTGRVKVMLSKDRCGSVRPLTTAGGKNLGTVTLSSDPETGNVTSTFSATVSGENVKTLVAQLAETEQRLRRETWAVIDEEPGIGSTELRRRVTGQTDAKNDTRLWLIEHKYIETRQNGKATGHYILKPLD